MIILIILMERLSARQSSRADTALLAMMQNLKLVRSMQGPAVVQVMMMMVVMVVVVVVVSSTLDHYARTGPVRYVLVISPREPIVQDHRVSLRRCGAVVRQWLVLRQEYDLNWVVVDFRDFEVFIDGI